MVPPQGADPSGRPLSAARVLALLALLCAQACKEDPGQLADPVLERGRQAYRRYCEGCHGEKGDGRGPAARTQVRPPRSFLTDRFVTTPGIPTDDDLYRIVTRGIPESAMPSFEGLDAEERRAVVRYVRARFLKQRAADGGS